MDIISSTLLGKDIIQTRKNKISIINFGLGKNPITQPLFVEAVKENAEKKHILSRYSTTKSNLKKYI